MNKAEQAMQQDKLAYYGRNGQERQLKGLNEKLERTLTQKLSLIPISSAKA